MTLPDLTHMEAPVRDQIEAQYRTVRSLADSGTAAPDVLARAYGLLGSLLLAADSFDAAEPCYRHAEALEPNEMRWPYYLGHVYVGEHQPDKAIAAFQRALRQRPGDVATLVWLGKVYIDQGQPDAAEPLFTQALAARPDDVSAMYGLGQAALAKRDYAAAVARFEQLLTVDPRASIVHYPLALAYRALGDTAKADQHLRQRGTVEVGPPDPLMTEVRDLLHSAAAEERQGARALEGRDLPTAIAHLRRAVELAPDDPSPRHRLATALSLQGDTRAAVEQFEETLRRDPTFSPAHYSLGVLFAGSGRYPEAIHHLTAAVRQQPDDVRARLQLAETFGRSRQFDRAFAEYQRVLAIDPQLADAQFGGAMSLVGLGRIAEARRVLRQAAVMHPDDARFADAARRLAQSP